MRHFSLAKNTINNRWILLHSLIKNSIAILFVLEAFKLLLDGTKLSDLLSSCASEPYSLRWKRLSQILFILFVPTW